MRFAPVAVLIAALAFYAGAYASASRTGSLVPMRDKLGGCQALDTDTGKTVGSWPLKDGRCAIRDYRTKHPFGG